MKKFLFICTGNTCRSPIAEGIFNYLAKKNNLAAIASSAGLFAREEEMASHHSIAVMKDLDIDISNHRARVLTKEILNDADIVLVMTKMHMDHFAQANKIFTLADYAGKKQNIVDPFMGEKNDYVLCRDSIFSLVEIIVLNELNSSDQKK